MSTISWQLSGLKLIANHIQEKCGIQYSDNLQSLESKIRKRLAELGLSHWEYANLLSGDSGEWDYLLPLVTINETYFFREDHQLKELTDYVLPHLKIKGELKVWSAACSTGDEPYSIAMSIAESLPSFLPSVRILATDIDDKVLQAAKRGWYSKSSLSFRRISQNLLERYFESDETGFRVKSGIKERVAFSRVNLLEEEDMRSISEVDVIFCRNVLIYFNAETTKQIITSFCKRLNPGGYLFLGHAETISGWFPELETIHAKDTFYYRKKGGVHE